MQLLIETSLGSGMGHYLKRLALSLEFPRRTILFRQPLGRIWITDDGFGFRVPLNFLFGPHCNIAEMADGCRTVTDADVSCRNLAGLNAVEEVIHMARVCL